MSYLYGSHDRVRQWCRRLTSTVALVLFGSLASAQTVTQPAARTDVPAAREFATTEYQDPINMGERTDLGWLTYSNDQPVSNLSNVQMTGGRFSAVAANGDPGITVLDTANPAAVPRERTGSVNAIDAGTYRTLAVRMRLTGSQGVRVSDGQLLWTSKSIYESAVSVAGSFWTYGGWQTYLIDVPALGTAAGSSWSGLVRWLRLDPTTVAGTTIEIDWIRLVATSDSSTFRTITWSGSSPVDIYLDDDTSEANGTLGLIAKNATTLSKNVSGGSFQFQAGALPRGDYYVAIRRAGSSDALKYSPGFYRVAGLPTLRFTSPSEEGSSDDFATARLGNAWDLASLSDVDAAVNATGVDVTTITAEDPAGTSLGNVSVLRGTSLSSGATGDPYVHLLLDTKRGAATPIDTDRYRILTFDLGLPGQRDMANGSVARVVWKLRGESAYNVSDDIVMRHRAGVNVLDRVTLDMKALPLETGAASPSHAGWNGQVDSFRIDPHEFTPATPFYLRRVRLAALERAGTSYRIAWAYDDAGSGARLSLFVDDDRSGFDGGAIVQGVDPADGGYTWNTASLVAGREYYIYSKLTRADGTVVNQGYARWPIVGGGTGSAPAPVPAPAPNGASNPEMVIDAPVNGAVLTQPTTVGGWAVDFGSGSGTGVDTVHVWAYPTSGAAPILVGIANYGGARPDVGAAFGARFTASGYGVQVQGLPPGGYQIVAFAHSTVTGTFALARVATVTLTGPRPDPRMAVDIPVAGQTVGTSFNIGGWAIDLGASSGPGVDAVHIWAYPATGAAPILVGVAPYGGQRPDVGAAFGTRATRSGYGLTGKGLAPGVYDLVVFAHSTVTGTFNNAQSVRITVR